MNSRAGEGQDGQGSEENGCPVEYHGNHGADGIKAHRNRTEELPEGVWLKVGLQEFPFLSDNPFSLLPLPF